MKTNSGGKEPGRVEVSRRQWEAAMGEAWDRMKKLNPAAEAMAEAAREAREKKPQPEPPQGELARENIPPAEKRILLALAGMYQQYCGGRFGHDFMGAGEEACEVLEDYGLMKADDEIDDMAVARLAGHKTLPPHPNATGDK